MKKLFFLGILGFGVLWLLGFLLYRIGLAFLDIYDDWQLGKELREIEIEAAENRRQRVADTSAEKERLRQELLQFESQQAKETAPPDMSDDNDSDDVMDID